VNKNEFLKLMNFPNDWLQLDMYPDGLFAVQLAGYVPGHEHGSEHDRNGAFHWWLRKKPTKAELENLVRLAAADPDALLGNDVLQYIREADAYDEQIAALETLLLIESERKGD